MDKAALDKMIADYKEKLLLDHVAYPDEVAEAYVFLMKWVETSYFRDRPC